MSGNVRGLAVRIRQNVDYWVKHLNHEGSNVDPDEYFMGRRIPLSHPQRIAPDVANRFLSTLRLFMTRLDGDETIRRRVESAIIRHLWNAGDAPRNFLYRPKGRSRPCPSIAPGWPRLSIKMTFEPGIRVCGLNGTIEEGDWNS
jgi:hypothetical protein